MEFLDILDEQGEKTGESRPSSEVHEKGYIHRAVHVWIVNSKGQLLLQKRSLNKIAYPNCWEISASGHVSSGETSIEAAMKETREEVGLTFPPDAFELLFTIRNCTTTNNGTYIANEFQDVYLVHADVVAESLVLQESEVSDARWIGVPEFTEWVAGNGEPVVPHEEEYRRLFEHLSTHKAG